MKLSSLSAHMLIFYFPSVLSGVHYGMLAPPFLLLIDLFPLLILYVWGARSHLIRQILAM